jgi:hypothetical protein
MSAPLTLRKVLVHLRHEIPSFEQKDDETIHVDVRFYARKRIGLREEPILNKPPLGSRHAVLRAVRKGRSHRDDGLKTSTDRSIQSKLLIDVAVSWHQLAKSPFQRRRHPGQRTFRKISKWEHQYGGLS